MKKKIIILYTEAGGGHKSAAKALAAIIAQNPSWQATLINPLKEICPEFDLLQKLTGIQSEDAYNKFVAARENSFFSLLLISGMLLLNLVWYRKRIVKKLNIYWQENPAEMVISVMPFINDVINSSIQAVAPQVPFVTLPTDYSECARKIWINAHTQYMLCGTDKLIAQAKKRRHPQQRLFQLSGMITRPEFYQVNVGNKEQGLIDLGLQPNLATGVVMFGSHASKSMLKIAKKFCHTRSNMQLIFICGHDTALKQQLENLDLNYPALILGYINNVQDYMALADFYIGKPGGASITEATIMRLPIILLAGPFTLLQEKYNARWIEENELGICVRSFKDITKVTQKLLTNLPQYQTSYKKINNKGIFEIPALLKTIAQQHDQNLCKISSNSPSLCGDPALSIAATSQPPPNA